MIQFYCKIEYAVLNKLFHKNGSQAGAIQRNALQLIDFHFLLRSYCGLTLKKKRKKERERGGFLCLGTE